MKVLYLANPLRSGTGGDRRSFEILKRIGGLGVEPVIIVDDSVWHKMKRSGNTRFSPTQKIYSIKRPNTIYDHLFKSASRALLDYYSIFKSANLIAQIAKQENVQLIISHHEKSDFLLEAYFASKRTSLPWTCIFQLPLLPPFTSTPWRRINRTRRVYLFALYSLIFKLIQRASESTILFAVSPSIEIEIKRFLPTWKSNLFVLRPGVGVETRLCKEEPKMDIDAVFFSRLSPEKGIYDLPIISKKMSMKKATLKVIVLGKFESPIVKMNFNKIIAQCKAGEHVAYKGFVDEETLRSTLKAAKVLIYPSQYDAFPLVVLEALACGLPVVAYDIPSIRLNFPQDIVRTVPVGDCQQMANQALEIIEDKNLHQKLSRKAVTFSARFSWKKATIEEWRAYQNVLRENSLG